MERRLTFPMLRAVVLSYQTMAIRVLAFARAASPWVAFVFVVSVLSWWLRPMDYFPGDAFRSGLLISTLILLSLLWIASAGTAHAWHRAMLIEHRAQPWVAVPGLALYVGRSAICVLGLLTLPIGFVLVGSLVAPGTDAGPVWWFILLALLVSGLVAVRLSPWLVAASIGEHGVTLRVSWMLTRGASWRLLAGVLLVIVPSFAAFLFGLRMINDLLGGPIGPLAQLRVVLMVSGWLFIVGLTATYLSLAYRFFVRGRGQLDPGGIDELREHFS